MRFFSGAGAGESVIDERAFNDQKKSGLIIGSDIIASIWDLLVLVDRVVDADAADRAGLSDLFRWADRAMLMHKRRGS